VSSRALILALVAVLALAAPASATPGDLGHDVGYSQCNAALPTTGTFGLVGVTKGLPFGANPCLSTEEAWAAGLAQPPALYVNTANPNGPKTATGGSVHWPTAGTGACQRPTDPTDTGCAYEYGRAAAADAFSVAQTAAGLDPTSVTWWLDVEGSRTPGGAGNSWVGSGVVNAADLQGFVDGLRASGAPEVGIYSTGYQWNDITQGYAVATASSYRSAWSFTAQYPLEDGPVWFAGVGSSPNCGSSFTGGERLLAQYLDGSFDGDARCADADLTSPSVAMTGPPAITANGQTAGWSGSDAGSGISTFDVRYQRAPYNGGFGAVVTPYTRVTGRSHVFTSSPGYTWCYAARSRDAAGNLSAWSAYRCSATPLDDTALVAGAGWSRASGIPSYYGRTFVSTSTLGATLTRTGVQAQQLTLLAVRCPNCGTVGVYLNGRLLANVDLHSATSGHATIPLPRFSLRSATVTLKAMTSGKLVRIDGLASTRA
jgi:hypothetical protein